MEAQAERRCGHVPPERWARIETTPAVERVWAERLGGFPAGLLAVCGAVGRGELRDGGGGVLHLTDAGRAALCPMPVARPMAQVALSFPAPIIVVGANSDRPAARSPRAAPAGPASEVER